jgi:hypothetical protein
MAWHMSHENPSVGCIIMGRQLNAHMQGRGEALNLFLCEIIDLKWFNNSILCYCSHDIQI